MVEERLHFLDVDWDASTYPPQPRLVLRDAGSGEIKEQILSPGDKLAYSVSKDRRCIGYIGADDAQHPCPKPSSLSLDSGSQCVYCRASEPLRGCRICRGSCLNPQGQGWCRQPHVVYLAAYEPGFVKVGVSTLRRWRKRIAEQGASIAITALQARDGGAARRAEARIKEELGVTDKSSKASRVASFKTGFTAEALLHVLDVQYQRVTQLSWSEAEPVESPDVYDLYTPYREAVGAIRSPMEFSGEAGLHGEVAAVRGWSLLISSKGVHRLVDLHSTRGRILTPGGVEPQRNLMDYL